MEDSKTLLFYLLSFAGLITASILFTGRIEPLPLALLPSTLTSPTGPPAPARPTGIAQDGCPPISERNIFHIPVLASLEANRLLISGTVYASDFATPLPGAVLEILSVPQETQDEPHYPPDHAFHDWFQTDAAGHYKATLPKPDDYGIIHLHYRANSQDDCPLRLQLLFRAASAQSEASFSRMKWGSPVLLPPSLLTLMKRAQPAGFISRGPIDVVLPVPPPVSFRANLVPPEVAGEPLTISGVVYASDHKTPLSGARVEVWQANPPRFYPGYDYPVALFKLGGQMHTDAAGRYEFTTLKPSPLKVGQTDLPAQIHFNVSYQDHTPLLTRLFFADDPFLNNIPPLPEQTIQLNEQLGPTGSVWQGNFEVVLPISPPQP